MKKLLYLLSFILISSVFGRSYSQFQSPEDTLGWCSSDSSEYVFLSQSIHSRTTTQKVVRVVFNIIWADTVASLPTAYRTTTYIDPEYVLVAYNDLVNAFEGSGFMFELSNIQYFNLADYPTYISKNPYTQLPYGQSLREGTMCLNRMNHPLLQRLANWNQTSTQYNPRDYMNVYVYPSECNPGIIGWSYIPPYIGDPSFYYPWTPESIIQWGDGVWVKSNVFGDEDRPGMISTAYNNGTLVHEVGHYLGLYHVFQGTSQCGQNGSPYYLCETTGDLVCDTAPTKQTFSCNPLCPDGIWPNDSPWADYESINYMGYYPDVCKLEFTPGQIERMHAYIEEYRPHIFEYVCEETLAADFNGDQIVGTADFMMLLSCFGPYEGCELYDMNNDGFMTVTDVMIFLSYYGMSCNPDAIELKPTQKIETWNLKY